MPPAHPPINEVGEMLYTALDAFTDKDEENGWALLRFCEAIGNMYTEVNDLVSDTDEGIGWSSIMDVERAPTKWLGWLAQFIGVTLVAGLDDAAQRQRIVETDGFKRGKPSAIQGAARTKLIGTQTVYLIERHGSVARTTVSTLPAETPDPAAVLEAILEQKPAGDLFSHALVQLGDWDTVRDTHADWTDVSNTFANWNEVLVDPDKQ